VTSQDQNTESHGWTTLGAFAVAAAAAAGIGLTLYGLWQTTLSDLQSFNGNGLASYVMFLIVSMAVGEQR